MLLPDADLLCLFCFDAFAYAQALESRAADDTSFLLMRSIASERRGKFESSLSDALQALQSGGKEDQVSLYKYPFPNPLEI